MEKFDGRSLSDAALLALRQHVVALHLRGISLREIMHLTQLGETAVRKIVRLYLQGGSAALAPRLRGRRPGSLRRLAAHEEAQVLATIGQGRPLQFGLAQHVWNRAAVHTLLSRTYGVDLPLRTVSHYLRRWGLDLPSALGAPQRRRLLNDAQLKLVRERPWQVHWCLQHPWLVPGALAGKQSVFWATSSQGQIHWLVAASAGQGWQWLAEGLLHEHGRPQRLVLQNGQGKEAEFRRWLASQSQQISCIDVATDFPGTTAPAARQGPAPFWGNSEGGGELG